MPALPALVAEVLQLSTRHRAEPSKTVALNWGCASVIMTGRGCATVICWVEVSDAAQCPTGHRMIPSPPPKTDLTHIDCPECRGWETLIEVLIFGTCVLNLNKEMSPEILCAYFANPSLLHCKDWHSATLLPSEFWGCFVIYTWTMWPRICFYFVVKVHF
jgi:hypothetical protein